MDKVYEFFGVDKQQFLECKKNNISKKLIEVAKECGTANISLSGRFKNDTKKVYYSYLTIEDLLSLLNPILVKNNLFIKVHQKIIDSASPSGEKEPYRMHVIVYIFVRDADSGEAEIFAEHGFGIEYGKPAYTKAINSALRLLWRNTLSLRYGEDNKKSPSSVPNQNDTQKNTKKIVSSPNNNNSVNKSVKPTSQATTSAKAADKKNTKDDARDKVVKITEQKLTHLSTKYKFFAKLTDQEFEQEYLVPRGLTLETIRELTMTQAEDIASDLKRGNTISA